MPTFEEAYYWLNIYVFNGNPYLHLGFTANRLREQLEELADGDPAVITELINRMTMINGRSTDPLELAEIQLVCARSYFNLGEYDDALSQLNATIQAYASDPHNQAVVFCMKGCVHLKMGDEDYGIQLWQRSLGIFQLLAKSQRVARERANWYQARTLEMEADILAVIG